MKFKHFQHGFIVILISAIMSTFFTNSLLADHAGPALLNPMPLHATRAMLAWSADDHTPQDLEALTTTNCVGGFADIYPCNNVELESFMPLNQIGGTQSNSAANNIWGWTDSLTGKEYAIISRVFARQWWIFPTRKIQFI